jgi:membrane protease YdiL (CAAX protease family)
MVVAVAELLANGTNLATLTTDQLTASLMSSPVLILSSLIAGWIGFGSAFLWAALVGPGNFWTAITARIRPMDLAYGLVLGAFLVGLQVVLQAAASAVGVNAGEGDNTGFLRGQPPAWTIVLAVSAAVVAPIVEELFFRGLFLHALLKRSLRAASNTVQYAHASTRSVVWAVVITSVVFGVLHVSEVTSASGAAFLLLVTVAFGAVLAWAAVYFGRLGPGIVAHIGVNAVGVVAAIFFS